MQSRPSSPYDRQLWQWHGASICAVGRSFKRPTSPQPMITGVRDSVRLPLFEEKRKGLPVTRGNQGYPSTSRWLAVCLRLFLDVAGAKRSAAWAVWPGSCWCGRGVAGVRRLAKRWLLEGCPLEPGSPDTKPTQDREESKSTRLTESAIVWQDSIS